MTDEDKNRFTKLNQQTEGLFKIQKHAKNQKFLCNTFLEHTGIKIIFFLTQKS